MYGVCVCVCVGIVPAGSEASIFKMSSCVVTGFIVMTGLLLFMFVYPSLPPTSSLSLSLFISLSISLSPSLPN